ncbi:MAG TPA: hypothetical protein VKZ81_19975 [Pseudonocardia sp.]|uniref:hypothetical protein n=1 Tax=Pseudonocardia sp. TaxID=60912 RepID=UPI002B4B673C|nr:hypothetical protein [Pseudonocardia sp.]HLU57740.1 hypothetical protein [Pseudonocardia sp.]
MSRFDPALRVADAVLFEGYVLYPYRASATKNQLRWQFGVLVPPSFTDGGEPTAHQAEVLLEPRDGAVLHVRVRFLHVQARTVQRADGDAFVDVPELVVDGERLVGWDEAVPVEVDATVDAADLLAGEHEVPIRAPAERYEEPVRDAAGATVGRIVRERWPLEGVLRLSAQVLAGPYVVRVRARVENTATPPVASRQEALRHALVAAHTLLAVAGGSFLSLLEPPEWARPIAAVCENTGVWPVLVGGDALVLASPIILYDQPEIAPESPGDLHDGLEIDEILALRTMALTDAEKREARATDPRAAAIVDRVDAMPQEVLDRLHGAIRYLRGGAPDEPRPWWDPGADPTVSPETDAVTVDGVAVARGSRVVLRPRRDRHRCRTDAQDLFLAGRTATVAAVLRTVDDEWHLAVTPDDDPEAAELMAAHGRYLYFAPDEVEPLEVAP